MKRLLTTLFLLFLTTALQAQQPPTPVNFLNTEEPERMCQGYMIDSYGEDVTGFTEPAGGALIRIQRTSDELCLYLFCDAPTHRVLIYSLTDQQGSRAPENVKQYGRPIEPIYFTYTDTIAHPLILPETYTDSAEFLESPVDVAVSSCGRYFDPETDFVYVLDQGNHRIVKFQYDESNDSLIWIDHFGTDSLRYPTAIDYADYGLNDPQLSDIFVTDGAKSKIYRFSAEGEYENQLRQLGQQPAIHWLPYRHSRFDKRGLSKQDLRH